MNTTTVTNQVTKATATVTIPAGASIRPSGAKWKATNTAGLSAFFTEIAEAENYANGRPARHDAWTGAVYGK